MFQHMHTTDDAVFSMQHTAYETEHSLFPATSPGGTTFRTQRLGTYLISDLFRGDYMAPTTFTHNKRLISLVRGKEIFFTGETFDQWDLDVLLHCVNNAPANTRQACQIQFSPADLLHSLHLRNNEHNRDQVFASLQRLHTGVIDISGSEYRYMTRLINRVLVDRQQNMCLVEINGDVVTTFRSGGTPMKLEDRRFLGRNGLGKWLLGATKVFEGGFTAEMLSLQALCGTPTKQKHCFANRLTKALDLLAENGRVESWNMDGDRVQVTTHPLQIRNTACGIFCSGVCA
ncbi:hypothetical protein [Pseudodesulfovibrio piezophilus]|nr:hypothetical protein [Pseudodesulfovibrio piezophilus]